MNIINTEQMQLHPYCRCMPEMTLDEFDMLKNDIEGSGQIEPIVVFEGMILDGHYRYKACIEIGIDPWFVEFDGPDSAMDYVVSKNLKRRGLTTEQKAMAWNNLCTLARGKSVEADRLKTL